MKKFLLFVFIIISLSVKCQEYKKFPTSKDNPVWLTIHETYTHNNDRAILFGLINDTTINSLTYSKIYFLKDTIANDTNIIDYLGCLREDSSKKIFIIYREELNEKLLFDFSKNKNEFVKFNFQNKYPFLLLNSHSPILHSLDSVFIDSIIDYKYFSKYYKIIITQYGHWNEGIGNSNNVFSPFYESTDWESQVLYCLKRNDTMDYGDCSCFRQIISKLSIDNKNNLKKQIISVYPNPSNHNLYFTIYNPTNEKQLLTIYYNDKTVYSSFITGNKLILDVSDWKSGLYIYRTTNQHGLLETGKIIIE